MAVGLNPSASSIANSLRGSSAATQQSLQRVSSGERINSAADDAAGLGIAQGFDVASSAFSTAVRNAENGISLLQTAQGNLNGSSDSLIRIRELTLQAQNDVLNQGDRQNIQTEIDSLLEGLQQSVGNAEFNGKSLFGSGQDTQLQVGKDAGQTITIPASGLEQGLEDSGLFQLDVTTTSGRAQALQTVDDAANQVSVQASTFGALENRLQSAADQSADQRIQASKNASQIKDADLAKEIADLTKNQLKQQIDVAVAAQANQQASFVTQLLQ